MKVRGDNGDVSKASRTATWVRVLRRTLPLMPSEWHDHTRLEQIEQSRFTTTLHGAWSVGGAIHGGYQMAIVSKAIAAHLPMHPDPFVMSVHFLSPATEGRAEVHVRVLRAGRVSTSVSVELSQEGVIKVAVLASYGQLAALPADVLIAKTAPSMAPPEECVSVSQAWADVRRPAPVMDRFDMLLDPASSGWPFGTPSGRAHVQAWIRLRGDHEPAPDPVTLLLACDALPPVTVNIGIKGWAPTMELTAYVRACPAPGWLLVSQSSQHMAHGMFEEDCDVWDSRGRLVCQSRQVAKMPRP